MLNPDDFTVGWICALEIELIAATGMLDEKFDSNHLPRGEDDDMIYTVGQIGRHKIVLTCLTSAGTTPATTAAFFMRRAFPKIRVGLMVGIGGGVPSKKHDIRLADIVVSEPSKGSSGVFQYDHVKIRTDGELFPISQLPSPPVILRNVVHQLKVDDKVEGNRMAHHIATMFTRRPRLKEAFVRPAEEKDVLFKSDYRHQVPDATCDDVCEISEATLVSRQPRTGNEPLVHYGLIASGNAVIRDGKTRDHLAKRNDLLCFEMEAAGLMGSLPCLVIRGISDYSDSHKNDIWQPWAALVAAAYAKELLGTMPVLAASDTNPVEIVTTTGTFHLELPVCASKISSQASFIQCVISGSKKPDCLTRNLFIPLKQICALLRPVILFGRINSMPQMYSMSLLR